MKGQGEGKAAGEWLDDAGDPGRKALRRALDDNVGAGAESDTAIARQRVWNRVQTPWSEGSSPRARWGIPLLVATAAGGAVALLIVALAGGLGRGGGAGEVAGRAAPGRPAAGPQVVPLPSPAPPPAFTTRAGERARHRLARGVAVELAPQTALLPGDDQAAPEVQVGEVRFSVPHQEGRRYSVRAATYRVVVLGTTFVVGVAGGSVEVTVENGVVEIEDAAGRRLERLERGQAWSSPPAGAAAAAEPPAEQPAPAVAPPRPAPARRPVAARAPARAAGLASDPLLRKAAEARRAGRPGQALALYQQLAGGGGAEAEIALYSSAEIQDRDLRDLRQALVTFHEYRTRYPGGLFRTEADVSIIEVLNRLGEERRALEEATRFLQRYPRHERRGEMAFIAGDLQRRRGNCAAAVRLYEDAEQQRLSGTDADDAAFHRAACLLALRDGRGPDAVRGYIARYPVGRHASEARRLLDASARPAGGR